MARTPRSPRGKTRLLGQPGKPGGEERVLMADWDRMLFAGTFVLLGSLAQAADGCILKTGQGERLQNGVVVKASPKTGTKSAILIEQTFQKDGQTPVHIHEQGDELFYVVSGRGTARLGAATQ